MFELREAEQGFDRCARDRDVEEGVDGFDRGLEVLRARRVGRAPDRLRVFPELQGGMRHA